MIDFDDIWQDPNLSEFPSMIIYFRCNRCGSWLSEDSLNLSVFLYGFFSIQNCDRSYTGFTCPSCLKTILIKQNASPSSILNKLSSVISFGDLVLQPKLTYFTSIYQLDHLFTYLHDLKSLGISFFHCGIKEGDSNFIKDHMNGYLAENKLKNHFCSFNVSGKCAPHIELLVLWVDEQHIEDLVRYEQDHMVKIIPRYMFQIDLLNRIEAFCAMHGFDKRLHSLNGPAKGALCMARERDIDFEPFFSDVQRVNSIGEKRKKDAPFQRHPERIHSYIQYPERMNTARQREQFPEDFDDTGTIMKILAADPYPWDFPGIERDWIKDFWKHPHPFKDNEIPTLLSNYKDACKDGSLPNKHYKMMSEIKTCLSKSSLQDSISSLISSFIEDYSKIVNKYAFSYADVWKLKERYLEKVYQCLRKKKPQSSFNPSGAHEIAAKEI